MAVLRVRTDISQQTLNKYFFYIKATDFSLLLTHTYVIAHKPFF